MMEKAQRFDMIGQLRHDMDRLRGELFNLAELASLPADEREAFKRCIRSTTYHAQAALETRLRKGA